MEGRGAVVIEGGLGGVLPSSEGWVVEGPASSEGWIAEGPASSEGWIAEGLASSEGWVEGSPAG